MGMALTMSKLTSDTDQSRLPMIAVDAIVKYYKDNEFKGIVLIERTFDPKGWAFPGGLAEYGETLEHAVKREVKEETGLEVKLLKQLHTYSDPHRDPRYHIVTVVYLCRSDNSQLLSGTDAKNATIFPLDHTPQLVFDHSHILEKEMETIKKTD
jgi:8-oxo-dGTP diphosphatase